MQSNFTNTLLSLLVLSISANIYAKNTSRDGIKIGDSFGGGIVFFIDNSVTPTRGLIAASHSIPEGNYTWGGFNNTVLTSPALFSGEDNTENMLAQEGGSPAAEAVTTLMSPSICEPPIISCTGWYIPSHRELAILWTNKDLARITNLRPASYWSSTESVKFPSRAWFATFSRGGVSYHGKTGTKVRVYPIRAFIS